MSDHLEGRLAEYLDGELPSDEVAEVREHLAACPECSATLEAWRAVDDLARRSAPPEMRAARGDVATRVRAQLLAEAAGRGRKMSRWLAAAAAVAAVLVFPWLVLQRGSPAPASSTVASRDAGEDVSRLRDRPASPFAQEPARQPAPAPAAAPVAPEPEPEPEHKLERRREGAPTAVSQRASAEQDTRAERKPPAEIAAQTRAGSPESSAGAPAGFAGPAGTAADDRAYAPPPASVAGDVAAEKPRASEERSTLTTTQANAVRHEDAGAAAANKVAGGDDPYADLEQMPMRTAEEARRRRDAWESFLRRFPASAHREAAGFGAVEAAAAAYRLERRDEDRKRLDRAVRAYLQLPDAARADEARRIRDEARRVGSP
jgi:hypothetical protein